MIRLVLLDFLFVCDLFFVIPFVYGLGCWVGWLGFLSIICLFFFFVSFSGFFSSSACLFFCLFVYLFFVSRCCRWLQFVHVCVLPLCLLWCVHGVKSKSLDVCVSSYTHISAVCMVKLLLAVFCSPAFLELEHTISVLLIYTINH